MTAGARFALAALMLTGLAGCGGGLSQGMDGVYAPGLDGRAAGADPLQAGHRLMSAGEPELALDAYMRAAAREGLTADTLAAMGSANLRMGRLGQAESLLRRAVAEDAMFVPAWNNLGVLLMEKRRFGEASEAFRRAYAADSGNSDTIRDNLRLALVRMEDPFYDAAVGIGGGTTEPVGDLGPLGTGGGGEVDFNDLGGGTRMIGVGEEEGALSPEDALSEIEPL